MVTHDIREAIDLSDRVLVLDGSPLKIKLDETLPKNYKVDQSSSLWQLEQRIVAILS
jgi:ABC-type nitrate/sulfonate/bicarbonate transport system ATPase subunit